MKRISQALINLTVTAGAVYVIYEFFLDERAKKTLREAAETTIDSVGKSAEKVIDLIADHLGDLDDGASTQEEADKAWERLGY